MRLAYRRGGKPRIPAVCRGGDRAAKLAGEQDTFADEFRVREGPRPGQRLQTHVRMATAPEHGPGQRCLHQVAASRGLRASRDTRRALGGQRAVDGNRLSRAVSASAVVMVVVMVTEGCFRAISSPAFISTPPTSRGRAARSGCARTLPRRRCKCTLAVGSCRSRGRRRVE